MVERSGGVLVVAAAHDLVERAEDLVKCQLLRAQQLFVTTGVLLDIVDEQPLIVANLRRDVAGLHVQRPALPCEQGVHRCPGVAMRLPGRLGPGHRATSSPCCGARNSMPSAPGCPTRPRCPTRCRYLAPAPHLGCGRFAMTDNGLGFALPWTPALERHLARHVAGVARESGGIEWTFGRKRGLEISSRL
jgi:hypothetical protein